MTIRSIAVMVLIETDDPRLDPAIVNNSTPAKTAALRRAVIDNLPNLTRVVMVMPEEHARLMAIAHDYAAQAAGLEPNYPPPGYVPPTRQ